MRRYRQYDARCKLKGKGLRCWIECLGRVAMYRFSIFFRHRAQHGRALQLQTSLLKLLRTIFQSRVGSQMVSYTHMNVECSTGHCRAVQDNKQSSTVRSARYSTTVEFCRENSIARPEKTPATANQHPPKKHTDNLQYIMRNHVFSFLSIPLSA